MEKEDIRRYSAIELRNLREARDYVSTREDAPEFDVDDSFWAEAELVMPGAKKSVHLRVDKEIFDWFKAQGPGHLTRMTAVLRSYYEAHKDNS